MTSNSPASQRWTWAAWRFPDEPSIHAESGKFHLSCRSFRKFVLAAHFSFIADPENKTWYILLSCFSCSLILSLNLHTALLHLSVWLTFSVRLLFKYCNLESAREVVRAQNQRLCKKRQGYMLEQGFNVFDVDDVLSLRPTSGIFLGHI